MGETEINYVEETYKLLDTIDFLPFIKKHKGDKFSDFTSELEQKYDGTEFTHNYIMEGYIFNWLSDIELAEYLEKRYPNDFRYTEVTVLYIY